MEMEPATFRCPVRRSNHWATKTQMAGSGASSTICCPCGSHNMLIILLKKTDISNVGAWRYAQMFVGRSSNSNKRQKSEFWAPDGDRIWKPSADRWDVLSIELPLLRMVSKGQGHCEENWRKWGWEGGRVSSQDLLDFSNYLLFTWNYFLFIRDTTRGVLGAAPLPFLWEVLRVPF